MDKTKLKIQLQTLKEAQKAKSTKKESLKLLVSETSTKFEDKVEVVKITREADSSLFTSAIKKLMQS